MAIESLVGSVYHRNIKQKQKHQETELLIMEGFCDFLLLLLLLKFISFIYMQIDTQVHNFISTYPSQAHNEISVNLSPSSMFAQVIKSYLCIFLCFHFERMMLLLLLVSSLQLFKIRIFSERNLSFYNLKQISSSVCLMLQNWFSIDFGHWKR